MRIVAYLDYSQRHLTQTIVAVTSTLHTIVSVSLPFRVLTRADCSCHNATNTGGQIALWRLTDRLQVTLTRHKQQAIADSYWRIRGFTAMRYINRLFTYLFTYKSAVNEQSGASTKLQLSWNKLITTLSGVAYARYTRTTHSRQCCNYNLIVIIVVIIYIAIKYGIKTWEL